MKEDTANNKAQKKFRAKEHGLNRSRKEFYLTDNEHKQLKDKLTELRKSV